ncbi:AAA family ATPase [Cellulomonas sp. JZ18]|uniref:AAA family ATPase n=1 Tax=Cellulomonas sp. JZ18 TaxID=2654191 RepID=UPI0012D4B6F3|nr:AAA family ATPase [Cellulomonas sp. JZ18]QGQ18132.1 AAA family ATPase [Cellulomonas sp. JZ18]
MHLRSLTVQAVGPFAARHTVDFAALGAAGLFLLEGPTGAGKSTLIDAVVFALYGKVASADASDERLRSAYAAPDVESVVDLVFEVPSGVYRVRRTPAYQRAKRRGSGTTTAQASARLWRLPADVDCTGGPDALDAVGELVSARLDEVGHELQRVVGLDRTQFVQTIVLPQGEFARFLRANPEDRRGLLQRIFGTAVYEQVQQRLVHLRREAERGVESARGALQAASAQLVGACGLDATAAQELGVALAEAAGAAGTGAQGPAARVGAVVDDVVARLTATASALAAEASAAAEACDAARRAHDDAVATAALLTRRAALRADRDRLEAGRTDHDSDVLRLAAARAAAAVRPLLLGAEDAATTWAGARKALVAVVDAAPDDLRPVPAVQDALRAPVPTPGALVAGRAPTGDDGSRDEGGARDALFGEDLVVPQAGDPADGGTEAATGGWRAHVADARAAAADEAAALRRLVTLEEQLDGLRRAVRGAAAAVDDLRTEVATHDAWVAARPDARADLVARRDAAREHGGTCATCDAQVAAADQTLRDVTALHEAEREHARTQAVRAEAARHAHAAVSTEAALRTARVAGLAGELAAGLGEGDACPVCGAVEHPSKAPLDADHVTAERVAAAEEARVAAEQRLAAASAAEAAAAARAASLRERVGDVDEGTVREALAAARAAAAAARAAAAEADRLDAELDRFDAATQARRERREEQARQVAAAEAALDAQRDALDRAEVEVVEGRGTHPTVAARHTALAARADVAQDLLDALTAERAAAQDAERRYAELEAALAEHGVPDARTAREAWLAPGALAALERDVRRWEQESARVADGLADPALQELAEDATADVEGARAAERAARAAADDLAGRARVAGARADAARGAGDTVRTAARVLEERAAEAVPVARMAGLAAGTGGDNAHALSLATYVLARRFEDVVDAANDRLRVMSDGRYELARSDTKEDVRTRTTGLSMRVVDHRTEQARDPRTLSGGETFYVSLCLALGMADVVTAEAGGVELGTLFVDEGFGTLDPHVLDQVLAELGRLRAGGRVVGVVSHVEALKQSVADRIEVRPTPSGPSTLTVLAG